MKAPLNRRVFVVGYAAATPLGASFARTWQRASDNEAGFRMLTRCAVDTPSVVGEIPDWDPSRYSFASAKELHNWNAGFVMLTMALCQDALQDAGLGMDAETGPRTACLVGSAINGNDAFRQACQNLEHLGPNKVSAFLLPNICANVPAGKAGAALGFTGPVISPQGACASGNHAIGLGSHLVRDGECDFALVGGVEMPLVAEIVVGFANMNATFKLRPTDRAHADPRQASRPFSLDRKGFVLSEGGAMLVLASEEAMRAHGLQPRAEVAGIGWNSDAHHFTRPYQPTIVKAMRDAISDAGIGPGQIGAVNAHGTSTPTGDAVEVACMREVFDARLPAIPVSANKSQVGHSLGAAAAVEACLAVEGLRRQVVLPTINHVPDPELEGMDLVQKTRPHSYEYVLSNAFGFGGTNCCVVFRGV
jgi:3-oxoacyl-[acyl-carrier-protein] synthase II